MQIAKIQNIFRYNNQYKNQPITKRFMSFQGKDIIELSPKTTHKEHVATKKFYRGKEEYAPEMFMQSGDSLFIKSKDSYIPYSANVAEYNSNGELIEQTRYNNGSIYIVNKYKNGNLVQEDKYEDLYARGSQFGKKTCVKKFKTPNTPETKKITSFQISRNYGKNWKKQPEIRLEKLDDGILTKIYFSATSEEQTGSAYTRSSADPIGASISIIDDDKYRLAPRHEDDIKLLYNALKELEETIQNEEFRADFGNNEKFNSELNKTIEFLSSKLNED